MSELQVPSELYDARHEEVLCAISGFGLRPGYMLDDCLKAAAEVVGISIVWCSVSDEHFLLSVPFALESRVGLGDMAMEEAVTRLNALPIGLQLADMQRELNKDISPTEADSFDEIESRYEDGLSTGDYPDHVVEYVAALEHRLNEAQGALFKMNGELMALKAKPENASVTGDKCLAQYNLNVGVSDVLSNMTANFLYEKEQILKRELVKAGVDIDNHSEVIKRCKKISYGDGSEQFVIDGVIVVRFGGISSKHTYRHGEILGPITFGANLEYGVTRINPDC